MSRAKQYAAAQQQAICKMLHISDEEYYNIFLEAGIHYAESTSFNSYMATIKRYNPVFWAWYANQFAITTEVFLKCYQYNGNDATLLAKLKEWWLAEHYPAQITVFPPMQLLEAVKEEEVEV